MIQLLGPPHHQATLSYLQCQPVSSVLGMKHSQLTSPSIAKLCPQGPSMPGCGFNPQRQNNEEKSDRNCKSQGTQIQDNSGCTCWFSGPGEAIYADLGTAP